MGCRDRAFYRRLGSNSWESSRRSLHEPRGCSLWDRDGPTPSAGRAHEATGLRGVACGRKLKCTSVLSSTRLRAIQPRAGEWGSTDDKAPLLVCWTVHCYSAACRQLTSMRSSSAELIEHRNTHLTRPLRPPR